MNYKNIKHNKMALRFISEATFSEFYNNTGGFNESCYYHITITQGAINYTRDKSELLKRVSKCLYVISNRLFMNKGKMHRFSRKCSFCLFTEDADNDHTGLHIHGVIAVPLSRQLEFEKLACGQHFTKLDAAISKIMPNSDILLQKIITYSDFSKCTSYDTMSWFFYHYANDYSEIPYHYISTSKKRLALRRSFWHI